MDNTDKLGFKMILEELIFVTGNTQKLIEAKKILGMPSLENKKLDLPELQGTAEEIVKEKAKMAFKQLQKPCFVDDTSLYFDAWGGLPGPYVKAFVENVGVDNFPNLLEGKDNSATAVCTIGYAKSKTEVYTFRGEIKGKIVSPGGRDIFSWDRVFMPNGYDVRFAEMAPEEKNAISHRKIAFEKFRDYLNK